MLSNVIYYRVRKRCNHNNFRKENISNNSVLQVKIRKNPTYNHPTTYIKKIFNQNNIIQKFAQQKVRFLLEKKAAKKHTQEANNIKFIIKQHKKIYNNFNI